MPTLDLILSKAAIRADAIRDLVTDKADQVLGSKKRVNTKILWAVGDFPKPWASDQEEIEAINGDSWFPSTDDFEATLLNSGAKVKKPPIVGDTSSFISLVFMQGKGTITQLNIVTHGASNSIGLSGIIFKDGGVDFTEELDAGVLQGFIDNGIEGNNGETIPWSEVRARFAKDAVIVIYACKAALSPALLQDIADTFGVTVKAFTTELHYTYSAEALSGGKVIRLKLKVDGESSLTKLVPNVTKSPSAPAQNLSP